MKWFAAALVSAMLWSTAPATSDPYFPTTLKSTTVTCRFGARATVNELENQWYSAQLSAAKEPSLYLASTHSPRHAGATLRFTWLRSFHAPVIVRIEGLGTKNARMIAKQLSGRGGYAPGSISKQLDRQLSPQELRTIELTLMRTKVLNLAPKICDFGIDGAQWIVESVDERGYHFVDRWSPESGPVRDLGLALLGLTGWDLKPIY